jgi:hypothetical protein
LWCNAAHIQNNRAESTTLQKQISYAECLVDSGPRFAG